MASSDASDADGVVVPRVRTAVRESLSRLRLLRSRRLLLLAVSGGADSLCLLDAVTAMLPPATPRSLVAHVDHQLRPSSAADAEQVRKVASDLQQPCVILAVDVGALAARERRGIEDAARIGRYRALRRLAQAQGDAVVLTGHTADDSVETVLLHLLRGTGLDGLGGLREREQLPARVLAEHEDEGRPLTVVRPLLGVSRADTVAYCEQRRLPYLTDETNLDPRLLRNRIRTHLLPVLRTYNPSVDRAVRRMASSVQDDEAWMSARCEVAWRRLATYDDRIPSVGLQMWSRQPIALRRRLVRHAARLAGFEEIGFEAVERALAVGDPHGPPRTELGGGLVVERVQARLRFVHNGGTVGVPPRNEADTAEARPDHESTHTGRDTDDGA